MGLKATASRSLDLARRSKRDVVAPWAILAEDADEPFAVLGHAARHSAHGRPWQFILPRQRQGALGGSRLRVGVEEGVRNDRIEVLPVTRRRADLQLSLDRV